MILEIMAEQYSDSGNETLEVLNNAERFTEWMYAQVKPHLQGTILEVGSGTGTYSKKIIRDFPKNTIILSEFDPHYVAKLKSTFPQETIRVQMLDLTDTAAVQALPPLNAVFALNVLEHIENDALAIKNVYEKLMPGGCFVILVPAHPSLYNRIDKAINHFRRYTKTELRTKAENAGFIVEDLYYFNFFSIPGWYLNGNIMKKETLDGGLITVFDRFVPLFRFFEEKILRHRIGISLVAVLRKP